MQLSGSPSQSVLQRNRSHDNHPIGGVRAKPLSKHWLFCTLRTNTTSNDVANIFNNRIDGSDDRVEFDSVFGCREIMTAKKNVTNN